MTEKKTAVFGLYSSVERAERAVDELVSAGFSNDDVSVLMADNQGSKDFAHEKQTKAPEGTTTGVAAGGTIGGTLGLLAGIGFYTRRRRAISAHTRAVRGSFDSDGFAPAYWNCVKKFQTSPLVQGLAPSSPPPSTLPGVCPPSKAHHSTG